MVIPTVKAASADVVLDITRITVLDSNYNGSGKTERCETGIPYWLLTRRPTNRLLIRCTLRPLGTYLKRMIANKNIHPLDPVRVNYKFSEGQRATIVAAGEAASWAVSIADSIDVASKEPPFISH